MGYRVSGLIVASALFASLLGCGASVPPPYRQVGKRVVFETLSVRVAPGWSVRHGGLCVRSVACFSHGVLFADLPSSTLDALQHEVRLVPPVVAESWDVSRLGARFAMVDIETDVSLGLYNPSAFPLRPSDFVRAKGACRCSLRFEDVGGPRMWKYIIYTWVGTHASAVERERVNALIRSIRPVALLRTP